MDESSLAQACPAIKGSGITCCLMLNPIWIGIESTNVVDFCLKERTTMGERGWYRITAARGAITKRLSSLLRIGITTLAPENDTSAIHRKYDKGNMVKASFSIIPSSGMTSLSKWRVYDV